MVSPENILQETEYKKLIYQKTFWFTNQGPVGICISEFKETSEPGPVAGFQDRKVSIWSDLEWVRWGVLSPPYI